MKIPPITEFFLRGSDAAREVAWRLVRTPTIRKIAREVRTPRLAVFVSDLPRAREAKLAYGLTQHGWKVVLLHRSLPSFNLDKYFEEMHQYADHREALNLAAQFRPVVYHVFAVWDFQVAAAFVKYRPGKVVFDDYDVFAGMMKPEFIAGGYSHQLLLERYCLENADGLCCRSIETQFAKRHMGYRYRGRRVLVLDSCWGGAHSLQRGASRASDGQIHVVYCGNVFVHDPKVFHYEVAEVLTTNRIHYHIYPSSAQLAETLAPKMSQYLDERGDPSYFHLHDPVPAEDLVFELAQYHYGLHLGPHGVVYDPTEDVYTQEKHRYSSANKIFDYAEAGLHILIHNGFFQRRLVSQFRLGSTLQNLGDLTRLGVPVPTKVPKAFECSAGAEYLTEFYKTL